MITLIEITNKWKHASDMLTFKMATAKLLIFSPFFSIPLISNFFPEDSEVIPKSKLVPVFVEKYRQFEWICQS